MPYGPWCSTKMNYINEVSPPLLVDVLCLDFRPASYDQVHQLINLIATNHLS